MRKLEGKWGGPRKSRQTELKICKRLEPEYPSRTCDPKHHPDIDIKIRRDRSVTPKEIAKAREVIVSASLPYEPSPNAIQTALKKKKDLWLSKPDGTYLRPVVREGRCLDKSICLRS